MGKMPETLKIYVADRYSMGSTNNDRDLKPGFKPGDEIDITTGLQRTRSTTYVVMDLYSNCVILKRWTALTDQEKDELKHMKATGGSR